MTPEATPEATPVDAASTLRLFAGAATASSSASTGAQLSFGAAEVEVDATAKEAGKTRNYAKKGKKT